MKRILILTLAGLLITGCGASNTISSNDTPDTTEEETIAYADADFISDLKTALQARWKLSKEYEESESGLSDKEELENLVDAELDVLNEKDYPNQPFEDNALKAKAISYLECLSAQKEATKYVSVDVSKYEQEWSDAYKERTKLLTDFTNDYGLTVDEEYKGTIDDLLTQATLVVEDEAKQTAIEDLANSITFEQVSESGDWKDYEAIVENNTDYNIEYLYIDIGLLDSDGVIVDTISRGIENVGSGEKAKISFSSDIDFEKVKITLDNYNAQ